jgi:hypothetical protein
MAAARSGHPQPLSRQRRLSDKAADLGWKYEFVMGNSPRRSPFSAIQRHFRRVANRFVSWTRGPGMR